MTEMMACPVCGKFVVADCRGLTTPHKNSMGKDCFAGVEGSHKLFPEESEHTKMLGQLLLSILVVDGVLSKGAEPTYPELVVAAEAYLNIKN